MYRIIRQFISLIILAVVAGVLLWPERTEKLVNSVVGNVTQEKIGIGRNEDKEESIVLTTQAITPSAPAVVSNTTSPFSVGNIVEATNQERIKAGLPPLSINGKLNQSAAIKTNDMIVRQYFEHVSPSGESVSDLGSKVGYDYIVMGENLALGDFKNAAELLKAWMDSPGHRANILNTGYQEIGVSAMRGEYQGRTVWFAVQHFGTARTTCPAISTSLKQSIDSINADLKRRQAQIATEKAILESPDRPTGEEYQQKVAAFNALVAQYNALLSTSQSKILQYNAQVSAFNKCLSQYQKK